MRLRVKRKITAFDGLFWLALAAWTFARGGHTDIGVLIATGALLRIVLAFREPPSPDPRAEGPGPLAATPAGRFRATGWPPSRYPDDYR